MNITLTDNAYEHLRDLRRKHDKEFVRLEVTSGGCAGFEYIFDYESTVRSNDHVYDYGKFNIVIDDLSLPYFTDATLDYVIEGINEQFKIINPAEKSSCGCGVSVQF